MSELSNTILMKCVKGKHNDLNEFIYFLMDDFGGDNVRDAIKKTIPLVKNKKCRDELIFWITD